MGKKRAALFDFDGTLCSTSKGYAWTLFMKYLNARGLYADKFYLEQIRNQGRYRKREITYEELAISASRLWAQALRDKPVKDVTEHANVFMKNFCKNIYRESFGLVRLMRSRGYLTVMISTSPRELATVAAKILGMRKVYSSELQKKGGYYTGRFRAGLNLNQHGAKRRVVRKLAHEIDLKGSFAFGDEVMDNGMLGVVGTPVALNPSPELRKFAADRGWPTLTHRNVVREVKKLLEQH